MNDSATPMDIESGAPEKNSKDLGSSVWIIEPRDALIVRDGRPFDTVPGARATSVSFPFPSTTTGGARTRANSTAGVFDKERIGEVKTIGVRGPLLIELPSGDSDEAHLDAMGGELMAPAPADALLMPDAEDIQKARLKRLRPEPTREGALTDLQESEATGELQPLSLAEPESESAKPYGDAPRFWRWKYFEAWLTTPLDGTITPAHYGHNGPDVETLTHVALQRETLTNKESALFQTRGLSFFRRVVEANSSTSTSPQYLRLGLSIAVDDPLPEGMSISPGVASLGGERRMMRWRRGAKKWPACPEAIRQSILDRRACRIVLLTPAHFASGWRPAWLENVAEQGVSLTLCAAAVGRPQVVSGWDLTACKPHPHRPEKFICGEPKPTRRLAPAGSVYFFSIDGADSPEAVEKWIDQTWMHCVSDAAIDRCDGFGVCALGVWPEGKVAQKEDV